GGGGGEGGASLGGGGRDDRGHVDFSLVGDRPLALQPAVAPPHLPMIRRKDNDCIPPQIHLIHHVDKLLNIAVTVADGVQVVVVEDGPHILTVGGDRAGPAVPALQVFQKRFGHAWSSQRFLEAGRKGKGPCLFVDRVRRWRRRRLRRYRLLNRWLAGDVAISKHDVVRVDEAGDLEERLAGPSRFQGLAAQPANALAGDQWVITEAAE